MEKEKKIYDIIIEEFNLEKLQKEDREDMANQIGGMVMKTALIRFIENMTKEELNDFDSMMGHNPSIEQITTFLRIKNSDFDQIINEEIIIFKKGNNEVMDSV